ncbi:MAG: alkaline phosphatase family protein [Promethearchaeota archaeon]
MSRSAKVNQVILIILDDVRAEHLFNWIRGGKLPNIAELAREGISCERCVTSFPSVTLPCYADIITGSNSGYFPKEGSGVPNYHWLNRLDPPQMKRKPPFIRNYSERRDLLKINNDIGSNVKTIFEQVGEGNLLSATSFLFRGSLFVIPKEYKADLILPQIEEVFKRPKDFFKSNEVPMITIGYIPHTDNLMHVKGFDHLDYINLVFECDKHIGSLINVLKDLGYYEDTAICITADHGNYKAPYVYDLELFFQQKGLIPYDPINGKGDFDVNFGSVGFFNFRGETWFHHPTIKQLENFNVLRAGHGKINMYEVMWKIPGVQLMYYQDDDNKPEKGRIFLESKDQNSGKINKGIIEYVGTGVNQKTKYTFNNEDIFDYTAYEKSNALLDNKFHTIDEWIPATIDSDFINLIDQLPRHFKNPRSCDIMVSTKGIYNFNYEHGKTKSSTPYSHDIAGGTSMFVPLIIGGSLEIPKNELAYCKTTDIVPTLLGLLGKTPHSSVIGKSIFSYKKQD